MGETHAVAEAELVLKDGISVPYWVIYDVAASKSPHCGSLHWHRSAVAADTQYSASVFGANLLSGLNKFSRFQVPIGKP